MRIRLVYFTLVLSLFVSTGDSFADAYNGDTVSATYAKLKETIAADSSSTSDAAYSFLSGLSSRDLLIAAEQASVERDSVILFGFVGVEMSRRLKVGLIDVASVIGELESTPESDNLREFYLLRVLHSTVHACSVTEQRRLYIEARKRTLGNLNDRVANRLSAMAAASSSLGELVAYGNADLSWVADYGQELTDVAILDGENPELRRMAIKGIAEIGYRDAIPVLLELAANAKAQNLPPVARSICVALADLEVAGAVTPIGQILQTTEDKYIFGSAAIALGDIGGSDALKHLVDNADRFNEGCADVAIRQLEPLIFSILSSGDSALLHTAIRASDYLYKEEHLGPLKALLMSVLSSTGNRETVRLVLSRLQSMIKPDEARSILESVPFSKEYGDEWEWMKRFGGSTVVEPVEQSVTPVPSKSADYSDVQEYGDPGYREVGTWWFPLKTLGHTGLFAGIDAANDYRCVEVGNDDQKSGVYDNSWSRMVSNSNDLEFWGTFQPANTRLTFEDRRNVMDTALYLIGRDIGYPSQLLIPGMDILDYRSNPGTIVSPNEIQNLRCDGLVEFAYERNDISVWGKNGSNYNLSVTANVIDHNVLYAVEQTSPDPNTGCAPVVQCGKAGGVSTYMTEDAVIHLPEYHVSYYQDGSIVHLFVKATDESGIHRIYCRPAAYPEFIAGEIRDQHPAIDNYRQEFVFPMSQSDEVYFYAIDNGGNGGPVFAQTAWIDICSGTPARPQLVIPTNNATVPQATCLEWNATAGATDYRVEYGLEEDFPLLWDDTVIADPPVTFYCPQDLQPGKRYWWRVRVWTDCGFSDWSDYSWFTTTCDEIAPPDPRISDYGECSCYIAFSPVPGALGYLYQADCFGPEWWDNDSWDDTLICLCGLGSVTLRLRTFSDCDTSAIDSIVVFKYATPHSPVLVSPGSGETDLDQPIGLDWEDGSIPNAGAVTEYYELQVDTNALFTNSETIHCSESEFAATGLAGGVEHFWRVRACNMCYRSGWTPPWSFRLSCPTLLTPVDASLSPPNGIAGELDVIFRWGEVEDAWAYEMRIDTCTPPNPPYEWTRFAVTGTDTVISIPGKTVYWQVRATGSPFCSSGAWTAPLVYTDVVEIPGSLLPAMYSLSQNYPNPFNPDTRIEFALPRASHVSVNIYDIMGRRIRTLVDGRLSAGNKVVAWNGKDEEGLTVSSGIYFYSLIADDYSETRKMVLLK